MKKSEADKSKCQKCSGAESNPKSKISKCFKCIVLYAFYIVSDLDEH